MKHCSKCGRILPEKAFSKRKAAADGLQGWCKKCRSKAYGKGKTGTPPKVKEPGVGFETWAIITDECRGIYRARDT